MKTEKPRQSSAAGRTRRAGGTPVSPRQPPPLITSAELRRIVFELANTLAPGDVGDLLGSEDEMRVRAAQLSGDAGTLLRAQLDLALLCLQDHAAGRCPQIPYFTISMLAAGLAYLVDELDLIPDFLPKIGTLDDALVMAMVFQFAADGLRRYCTWKDIDPTPALGTVSRRR
jgi:uncharacterized membrane protein YkvA (DUF1232 family)